VIRTLRTMPTLLRVGFAAAVAYRAEFIVWMLTTTMPLVMLALWSAVAHEAPFGRWGQEEFIAYYLGALIVRTLTGCWVVWEMNHEVRSGMLSLRLLRPIHPFFAYLGEHLAQVPLRGLMALPIAGVLLLTLPGGRFTTDPVILACLPLIFAAAWGITFLSMCLMGSLAMLMERSVAVFEVWLGLFAVLSGYLVPLELMPSWLASAASWLPFRYQLGFPVEAMIGALPRAAVLEGLAAQWAMVFLLIPASLAVWRAGLRRFEAFGG
jgi:ABC-2 type transport system permease protein